MPTDSSARGRGNMPLCLCAETAVITHTHTQNLQGSNTKCVLLSCNKANNFLTINYKYY